MLGLGTLAYWLRQAPLATGRASQALFASHLLYGLVLGLAFPFVHSIIQRRSPSRQVNNEEQNRGLHNRTSTNARST
jgi:hypothetical protein